MPDRGTKKKVTRVGGEDGSKSAPKNSPDSFVPEKKSAKKLRIFAVLAWIAAIGFEVWAIFLLQKPPVNMAWLIALIVADLIFAVTGSLLWKRANRHDPASESEPFRFFIQNQLGAIISVIAFLPLIILIFLNKDMDKKQKSLAGVVGIVALLIAGYFGIDFNPPSVEKYARETSQVKSLMGVDNVYWTKAGTRYHLYSDCYHINTKKTDEIFSGTVAQAKKLKDISILCETCRKRADKENLKNPVSTTEKKLE